MSVLEGSLEHFSLPDVFRLLARNHVTGALKVVRASGEGVVFLREGEVYFAFSNLTREFLGQRLVNAKLITEGQLLRVLDEQKKSEDKRIGDLLVEKGFVSKDLLDTFLKEQIQDAIFSMLQWDVGSFQFLDTETAPQEVGLSVSVENLIMESSRRIQEWEVINRKIPTMDVVVRMAPAPPEGSVEINIRPDEWTVLVLADGKRTVREIAAASERSEFEACKIIYGLITSGLLDVSSSATGVGAAPPAAGQARKVQAPAPLAPEPLAHEPAPLAHEPAPLAHEPAPPSQPEPVMEAEPAVPAGSEAAVTEQPSALEAEEEMQPVTIAEEFAERAVAAGAGETRNGVDGSETEKPVPVQARRKGDPAVSKELLLRLIAGVRNL